ncbi:MAG: restriction endonuclease subunit S [Bryobacteraceae bacterium]|nr:restriction endonuclease subunit S [Bryobacteraceae bacterium]
MTDKEAKITDDWVPVSLLIPEHWAYVAFDNAFETLSTSKIKIPEAQYLPFGTIPIVDQGKDLVGGYTEAKNCVLNEEGSVIVFGDHTRCFKLIGFPFAPGADGTKVLKPSGLILPKFAYYGCLSLRLPDRGYSRHYSFLRRSKFPIAPLSEQARIVAKIEELFSELDEAVESLTKAREQLKAYRQSILKHAFKGKLTSGSRSVRSVWRETTVGAEIDFLTSGSRGWADYYADEGEIFIRAQNLKHDRLDLTDVAFVKLPSGSAEGVRTRVQGGDVLITITGANVTKTGLLDADIGPAYVSQHVALCRPSPSILPEFLYWYLLAESGGRRQLNKAAYGAGKPGLNLDNIREVTISLPEIDEQAHIVGFIRIALSAEQALRATIDEELARASALRHSLLKAAFTGELVKQDPNDEFASILLGRILTDRRERIGNAKETKKKAKSKKDAT